MAFCFNDILSTFRFNSNLIVNSGFVFRAKYTLNTLNTDGFLYRECSLNNAMC